MAGVRCVGHAMAMHLKHHDAAARGAALVCGNTDTKTSNNLVDAIVVGLASSSLAAVAAAGGMSKEAATTEPKRTIKWPSSVSAATCKGTFEKEKLKHFPDFIYELCRHCDVERNPPKRADGLQQG